jgi:hypothetical protein
LEFDRRGGHRHDRGLLLEASMNVFRLACALALIAGCNNDTESAREGAEPSEPAAKTIRADEGGKVGTAGAEVQIPAGALAKDTKITIEELEREGLPELARVASKVFDFGPDGTEFAEPVALTIDFDAARTPKKMRAVMAFLDGDEWQPLADSEVDDNSVVAHTTHFTPFAVLFAPEEEKPAEDVCEVETFEACGGDLIGSWMFDLGCLTLPDNVLSAGDDAFAMCDAASANARIELGGTITFGEDGTYEIDQTVDTTITKLLPKGCLEDGVECDSLSSPEAGDATDEGDHCQVIQSGSSEHADTGSYVVEDNTYVTTSEGAEMAAPAIEYCVDGDKLTAKASMGEMQTLIYRATRQ